MTLLFKPLDALYYVGWVCPETSDILVEQYSLDNKLAQHKRYRSLENGEWENIHTFNYIYHPSGVCEMEAIEHGIWSNSLLDSDRVEFIRKVYVEKVNSRDGKHKEYKEIDYYNKRLKIGNPS